MDKIVPNLLKTISNLNSEMMEIKIEKIQRKLYSKLLMSNSKIQMLGFVILTTGLISCASCSSDDSSTTDDSEFNELAVLEVNANYFTTGEGSVSLTTVPCTLSDGTETDCYQIVTTSTPSDHSMGPWCPDNIADDTEAGGIWLESGEVYDVDGEFIENMASFYNDSNWLMYDENGDIYVTDSEEDCINAANPNVGEEYENFCVECLPSYITDVSQTFLIPITPVLQNSPAFFATGPGGPGSNVPSTRGIALNGVEFSAPAPTDRILGAYTLAPFDDAGGHINVHQGYHYHAATGYSTKIEQEDEHSALFGYALDGIGIYELLDANGEAPTDLDELRGHTDDVRGYHYHVDEAGNNNFINGLKGAYAI
ncbi:YHYH protein [Christiangramia echinicola]|uniref:YHYH protein n=2 Tax=Christiangramia echinicola TaxID=279359 RepID=A0A1H1KZN9_9FLAO|nr:YHYH protein [Christiangramia echinicola]